MRWRRSRWPQAIGFRSCSTDLVKPRGQNFSEEVEERLSREVDELDKTMGEIRQTI